MVPFGIAFSFMVWWYTAALSVLIKVRQGRTLTDSISDIVLSYIVWIFTPTAFVSTIYAVLLGLKTDDLNN